MNQCGYCKKANSINLIPVTVVSRGKRIHSMTHYHCMLKWRRIAVITVDTFRITDRQAQYLSARTESDAASKRKWNLLHKKTSLTSERLSTELPTQVSGAKQQRTHSNIRGIPDVSVQWHEHQFFVLRALRIGKTKKEIAEALCVTTSAIRMLLMRLRREYNVQTNDELLALFYEQEKS